jgi:replicative DNA helicase
VRQSFADQPIVHIGCKTTKEEVVKQLQEVMTYTPGSFISTGLPRLDFFMKGFARGNLVTLSATRGGCKSLLAMAMGLNQYFLGNHSVVFVSMEMSKLEVQRRMFSNISGIPHEKIRIAKFVNDDPQLTAQLNKAIGKFWRHGQDNNCRFSVWDVSDPFFTPMKLDAALGSMGYDVIIIDYLTLFYSGKMDTREMIMEYSRYLHTMAKRLKCVIIVLTQLNDDDRSKYGKAIEENTDYWIYWRWDNQEQGTGQQIDLLMEKARHTQTRKIQAVFRPDIMQVLTLDTDVSSSESSKDNNLAVGPESDFWGGIEGKANY